MEDDDENHLSVAQVAERVRGAGMSELAAVLSQESIDGEGFALLDRDDVASLLADHNVDADAATRAAWCDRLLALQAELAAAAPAAPARSSTSSSRSEPRGSLNKNGTGDNIERGGGGDDDEGHVVAPRSVLDRTVNGGERIELGVLADVIASLEEAALLVARDGRVLRSNAGARERGLALEASMTELLCGDVAAWLAMRDGAAVRHTAVGGREFAWRASAREAASEVVFLVIAADDDAADAATATDVASAADESDDAERADNGKQRRKSRKSRAATRPRSPDAAAAAAAASDSGSGSRASAPASPSSRADSGNESDEARVAAAAVAGARAGAAQQEAQARPEHGANSLGQQTMTWRQLVRRATATFSVHTAVNRFRFGGFGARKPKASSKSTTPSSNPE